MKVNAFTTQIKRENSNICIHTCISTPRKKTKSSPITNICGIKYWKEENNVFIVGRRHGVTEKHKKISWEFMVPNKRIQYDNWETKLLCKNQYFAVYK